MHTPTSPLNAAPWRVACAAAFAALLVACGGGGGDAPVANGTASAQSFATGPITGLGSVIVNGVRCCRRSARR